MKRYIFFVIITFFQLSSALLAQSDVISEAPLESTEEMIPARNNKGVDFGIGGGVTMSKLKLAFEDSELNSQIEEDLNTDFGFSYLITAKLLVYPSDRISVQAKANYEIRRTKNNLLTRESVAFLHLPFLVGYHFGADKTWGIALGPHFSVEQKSKAIDYSSWGGTLSLSKLFRINSMAVYIELESLIDYNNDTFFL